jgi:crotonobetainyl-CoA:carnitine CoA-transferase CaiB-like acyl-CoA transferase
MDLRAGARQELIDVLADADVFVQSWEPGAAARCGLDYADLHDRFPALICCAITGFGLDGPNRDLPGYEALVHAVVGTMGEQLGEREGPIFEALPFASTGASYLALIGTLSALYRRARDGVGRSVETSLLDGALAYLSMLWGDTDADPAIDEGHPSDDFLLPASNRLINGYFLCADDKYIGVHTGAVGAFGRLMSVLGLQDRIQSSDTGIDMGIPLTAEERDILHREIHRIFASQPRSFWEQCLTEADVCAIPLLRPGEIFDEPQARFNNMMVDVDDPVLGLVTQVAPPVQFPDLTLPPARPAPTLGQDAGPVLETSEGEHERPWLGSAALDERPLLDGVNILDLGAFFAGPYASRLLADLGADVIKLEPVNGDPLRGLPVIFRSAQAGKRSMAADLKDPGFRLAANRLIEWADVIHHNMRPGAAERLGIGPDVARALNQDVIYGYAPGWGVEGPYATRQSFEPMMSGYIGVAFEVAGQFNRPMYPAANADPGNGLVGAVAMLMALLHRCRTGDPTRFVNPQLNAAMSHLSHIVRQPDGAVLGAGRLDPLQMGFSALERLYETADGWVCIVVATDADIAALDRLVSFDLLGDPRFASDAARRQHDYELGLLLQRLLLTKTTSEWLVECRRCGVPATEPLPYNNRRFLRDPENHRSGRVAQSVDAAGGTVREIGTLVRVSHCRTPPYRLAPGLGQHTHEILVDLGYSPKAIESLLARHAISTPDRAAPAENVQ